jgi:hypothetical protein
MFARVSGTSIGGCCVLALLFLGNLAGLHAEPRFDSSSEDNFIISASRVQEHVSSSNAYSVEEIGQISMLITHLLLYPTMVVAENPYEPRSALEPLILQYFSKYDKLTGREALKLAVAELKAEAEKEAEERASEAAAEKMAADSQQSELRQAIFTALEELKNANPNRNGDYADFIYERESVGGPICKRFYFTSGSGRLSVFAIDLEDLQKPDTDLSNLRGIRFFEIDLTDETAFQEPFDNAMDFLMRCGDRYEDRRAGFEPFDPFEPALHPRLERPRVGKSYRLPPIDGVRAAADLYNKFLEWERLAAETPTPPFMKFFSGPSFGDLDEGLEIAKTAFADTGQPYQMVFSWDGTKATVHPIRGDWNSFDLDVYENSLHSGGGRDFSSEEMELYSQVAARLSDFIEDLPLQLQRLENEKNAAVQDIDSRFR